MRALIIDDDAAMSRMIWRCLSRWGWSADERHSVSSALESLRREQYALAVCDIEPPGGDGVLLAQALTKSCPTLRVVMVSADPRQLQRARRAGLYDCIRKPFELPEFKALVGVADGKAPLRKK